MTFMSFKAFPTVVFSSFEEAQLNEISSGTSASLYSPLSRISKWLLPRPRTRTLQVVVLAICCTFHPLRPMMRGTSSKSSCCSGSNPGKRILHVIDRFAAFAFAARVVPFVSASHALPPCGTGRGERGVLQSLKDWSEGSGTCAHARSSQSERNKVGYAMAGRNNATSDWSCATDKTSKDRLQR